MIRPGTLALAATILFPLLTKAQSSARETVTQGIEWFTTTANIRVHKNFAFIADGQFRFAGPLQPMQMQYRGAIDIIINDKWSLVPLGYVFTHNPLYGKQPNTFVNNEHRFWGQLQYKHETGRFNFSHRGRYELRYIQHHAYQNGEVVDHGYDFHSNRVRYRVQLNVPVNKEKMEAGAVFVSVYDEAFYSWGGKATYRNIDQNRIFVGGGYQANKQLNIAAGFLYQMLVKSNGAKQENNLGVHTTIIYNLDLTK